MTDLTKFDSSTIMKSVRERIQETFVSLIPEEHWEALCKKEVDEFFREKENHEWYRTVSHFQKIIQEELSKLSAKKIQEFLADYDSQIWAGDGMKCSEMLKELIIKSAPEIFASTFGNMFQTVVSRMKQY